MWLNQVAISSPAALNIYATGGSNSNISIEYPFKANKTYDIEINGVLDHQSSVGAGYPPEKYVNAVFWLKLDNNPAISSNAPSKCEPSLTPVEKIVDRYSKLIADGDRSIYNRKYNVKFATLEAKNALKIIYDPSPADPNIAFDEIFRLQNVKITEIPFEELYNEVKPFYRNTKPETLGENTRSNPLYKIPYTPPPLPPNTNPPRETVGIRPGGFTTFGLTNWIESPDRSKYISKIENLSRASTLLQLNINTETVDVFLGIDGGERIQLPFKKDNILYDFIQYNGGMSIIATSTDLPNIPVQSLDHQYSVRWIFYSK
jgi:hypothetical protein